MQDFAGDVVPLLDALHVERAVLAGHSGSCLVVRRTAIDRPERVAGLALEASPTTLRGHPLRRPGRAGRITAPTLLIWGDGDALVGRHMQEQLAELIPSAELLVYSGIGHTPRWEDASRFTSDLAAFIERLGPA